MKNPLQAHWHQVYIVNTPLIKDSEFINHKSRSINGLEMEAVQKQAAGHCDSM